MWLVLRITHIYPVCAPFCLGIQFFREMFLYPAWIYSSSLGAVGIFVRVGVKTEFIAWWLPSRMKCAMIMGLREDPPCQCGRLLLQEKGRRSPCSCGTKINK